MIDKFKKWFYSTGESRARTAPDLSVATCALLLEAAEADQEVPPEEHAAIVSLLQEHFSLSLEEVEQLIAQTQRERSGATDLWPFTNAISRAYAPEQKLELLVMVWRVIFADGRLDPYEDQLAHRLERMLSVNHSLLMEAKALARQAG